MAEILKEVCSYTDSCTMSAKKDALVNIGGWLATNDEGLYEEARNMVVVYEGLHTYGGLAGPRHGGHGPGHQGSGAGRPHPRPGRPGRVPGPEPAGLEACPSSSRSAATPFSWMRGASMPHIPQEQYPAQTLAADIYIDSGVRTMERGIVSAGRDTKTGQEHHPSLELVRLTIPRRVYTQAHMDVVAESVPGSLRAARAGRAA